MDINGMLIVTEDEFHAAIKYTWSMTYCYELNDDGKYIGLKVNYGPLMSNGKVDMKAMYFRHIDNSGKLTQNVLYFLTKEQDVEEAL